MRVVVVLKQKKEPLHHVVIRVVLFCIFFFLLNTFYVQLNKTQLDSPISLCIQLIQVWYFGSMKKNVTPHKYAV